MTDPRFATGGFIDSGVDADHPPPWLDGGCTYYVPERDGAIVTSEQIKAYLPLLEAIDRTTLTFDLSPNVDLPSVGLARSTPTALTEDELSHLYAWLQEGLPHCRCGSPDESDALVVGVLELIANDRPHGEIAAFIGGPAATWQIVLGAIERAGLISHGTSCSTAWITERGDWVRQAYQRVADPDEELDLAGVPHDGLDCPTDCALGQLSDEGMRRRP